MWFDLINDNMTGVQHPLALCAARRFGSHISSPAVRSAILFYSSYRKERKISCLGMEYLAQFYNVMREAIERKAYVELLYACYAMCLYEMSSKRRFSEEFAIHANGFLITYQNLLETCALSEEEFQVMSGAYDVISKANRIASSQWHQDGNWLAFAQTCILRLNSAAVRGLNQIDIENDRSWIPVSHPLHRAEDSVFLLCSLFNQISSIIRNEPDAHIFDWNETVGLICESLDGLWQIISQSEPEEHNANYAIHQFILKDEFTALRGDMFTRQLLLIYYILSLQYLVLIGEWSKSTCPEIIKISMAICRLFSFAHESTYPGLEMRFVANRGLVVAGIIVVESKNIGGFPFFLIILIVSQSEYKSKADGCIYCSASVVKFALFPALDLVSGFYDLSLFCFSGFSLDLCRMRSAGSHRHEATIKYSQNYSLYSPSTTINSSHPHQFRLTRMPGLY